MSAVEKARDNGWLPAAGPAHTRAVVSIILFIAALVLGGVGIGGFSARGGTDGASFYLDAELSIDGVQGYSAGSSGGDDKESSLRAELALARAQNVETDLGSVFSFWVLIGVFFSGRPRSGPKFGVVASAFCLLAVSSAKGRIEDEVSRIRWPLKVTTHLEFGWGYWLLVALLFLALGWNIARWILDVREDRRLAAT